MNQKFSLLLLAIVSVILFSCSKSESKEEDPIVSNKDPEGTVTISVIGGDEENSFKGIYITEAGNFKAAFEIEGWRFYSMGDLKGLGYISEIPDVEYSSECMVKKGNGYIARRIFSGLSTIRYEYIRFWVESFVDNKAAIRYQYPFEGRKQELNVFDSDSLVFLMDQNLSHTFYLGSRRPYEAYTRYIGNAFGWISFSNDCDSSFTVALQQNETEFDRECELSVVVPGYAEKKLKIVQKGVTPYLRTNQSLIPLTYASVNGSIEVESNVRWYVFSDAWWCNISSQSTEPGNGTASFYVSSNNTSAERIATLKFMTAGGSQVVEVKIIQGFKKRYMLLFAPGGSQTPSPWNPGDSATAIGSLNNNHIFEGYLYFGDNHSEFRYTTTPDWSYTYGDTGADGTLELGGNNIITNGEAGVYKLNANMILKTHRLQRVEFGIIGTATSSGWDNDQDMSYNITTKLWTITTSLKVGSLKFRANDSWDVSYGDNNGDGILEEGTGNIAITEAGIYQISLDLTNPEYRYSIVRL